ASSHVSGGFIMQAAATERTNQATYVAFRPGPHTVSAFRITATSPPPSDTGWGANQNGGSSPFVTSTDGINDMIVWVVGGDDQRLHGYDGDTGAVVYAGGGANELMAGTHSYSTTGIAARGRIYVAGDNKVYAFTVTPCVVSHFIGTRIRRATSTWVAAGFRKINITKVGNPGQLINFQSIPAGTFANCSTTTITVSH